MKSAEFPRGKYVTPKTTTYLALFRVVRRSSSFTRKISKMNHFSKVEQPFSFKIVSTSPGVTVGEEISDISRDMGDSNILELDHGDSEHS